MDKFFYHMFFLSLVFLGACKKNELAADNGATLNVINGIIKKDVLVKMNGRISSSGANSSNGSQNTVPFGLNLFFYAQANNVPIDFLNNTDSSSLVSKNFDVEKGGIYTVLLAGIAPNVEAVVIDDSNMPFGNLSNIPTDADSVINVRYINLCPDAQPLDIRLTGATTNEVSGLPFKGYTAFKAYPGKVTNYSGTTGYTTFKIDVLENGILLKTFSMFVYTPNRFKNVALVITGMKAPVPGTGQPAFAVGAVFYYQ